MFELYPHQQEVVQQLRDGIADGHMRQVLGMPTGSGKTVVVSHIIESAAQKGHTSLFVVDRIQLVSQAARHLTELGLRVAIVQGENTYRLPDEECVVATIQTLRRRGFPKAALNVIDECHILHRAHLDLLEERADTPTIGLSATPLREGLGEYFSRLVRGPSTYELIMGGYLAPYRCFGPPPPDVSCVHVRHGDFIESELSELMRTKEIVGDVISTWQQLGENRRTVCFASDIAHSQEIVAAFRSEGVNAAHLDYKTSDDDRKEIIKAFRFGDVQVLSSVAVLAVGFDAPEAQCVIMARPTLSEMLYVQQVGRGARICDGKADCIVLDHAGNIARFGLPQDFKIPDLSSGSVIHAKPRRDDPSQAYPCSQCGAMMKAGAAECPECGHVRARRNKVSQREGELVSLDAFDRAYQKFAPCRYCGSDDIRPEKGKPPHGAGVRCMNCEHHLGWLPKAKVEDLPALDFYLELKAIAQIRGFKSGWAAHKFKGRWGEWPPGAWRDLASQEPSPVVLRWVKSQHIAYVKRREKANAA